MANISFLDLMLAEALAAGLARDRQAAEERPAPDNFFVLPHNVQTWKQIKTSCEKENMVVCIEITNKQSDNCRKVQRIFMDMAREFDNIIFLRAFIEPGSFTFDALRADVGGVRFMPTFLILFFDEDSMDRAKFEGHDEILAAVAMGRIEGIIKELVQRRAKLKMVKGLIAQHLKNQVSERERKVREEYENRFQRKLKEREEELKKREEELRKKEVEKRRKVAEEERRSEDEEKLKKERPKVIAELLETDLDKASGRVLRQMMEKLSISTLGCLEKQDFKKQLIANVPELRIRESGTTSATKSDGQQSTASSGSSSGEVETLRRDLAKRKSELEDLSKKFSQLKRDNGALKKKHISNAEKDQVIKELEENLLETRMLYTTCLDDFKVLKVIHEPSTGDSNADSLVLRVECKKKGIPNQGRIYAMKILANHFKTQTQTQVRQDYQNEYEALCRLPQHPNIIRMWAFFFDRGDPKTTPQLKSLKEDARTMSLFILMDEQPQNMAQHLETLLANGGGAKNTVVLSWIKDLLCGLCFLVSHNVLHRDLKLNNLLLSSKGNLIISDFGKALVMNDSNLCMERYGGFDVGGNEAHLAPEILNCKVGRSLDYSKQPVWAAGVLAYELAGHKNPFSHMELSQRSYKMTDITPLKKTKGSEQGFPAQLTDLVESMLNPDPGSRPTLAHCLDTVESLV